MVTDTQRQKLQEYLLSQQARRAKMETPEFRQMEDDRAMRAADSSSRNNFAALLMNSAAQVGSIGGKMADASPVEAFAKAQNAGNAQHRGMIDQQDQDREKRHGVDARVYEYLAEKEQKTADGAATAARQGDQQRLQSERDGAMAKDRLADNKRADSQFQATQGLQREKMDQDLALSQAKTKNDAAIKNPTDFTSKIKSLSAEQSKRLDNSAMALESIEDMKKALNEGSRTFSLVGDNVYTAARTRFEEALGRMQSGGAIQKDEATRFAGMVPTFKDDSAIAASKMQKMADEMAFRVKSLGFDPAEVMAERKKSSYTLPEKAPDTAGTAIAAPSPSQTQPAGTVLMVNDQGEQLFVQQSDVAAATADGFRESK